MLKANLGTGLLAMPMAFKNSGLVFGSVGTIIVGLICTHCVQIVVQSSQTLCRRENIPSLGFAETAEIAFKSGPPKFHRFSTTGRLFVNGVLTFTCYATVSVYVVFIASNVQQLAQHYWGEANVPNIRVIIAMLLVLVTPLALVRNLKYLVPFSAMADVFILVSLILTLFFVFRDPLDIADKVLIAEVSDMPIFFATAIFAMEGIGMVMPLENSMKKPQNFSGCTGVLSIAMSIVVALYVFVGFFGYLRYGDEVRASITLNLNSDEIPAQLVKMLYALSILFSCGLQFYVPTSFIWPTIEKKIDEKYQNISQYLYRIVVICTIVGIAAAVPQLGPIISLIGSICFSTLGLFIPATIDTITRWEGELGAGNWRLWKNAMIILFSFFSLIAGSYSSILEIIDTY